MLNDERDLALVLIALALILYTTILTIKLI
jgi:hypothetical protein